MKSIAFLLVASSLLSTAVTLSAAPVCDAWGGGNCIDPRTSSGSSGGSSSGGPPPVFFDGHRTARAVEMIEECGTNPLCMMLRACLLLPIGLMFDAPVYAVKGTGYGLYYGAIGLGKGVAGVGRGIAYPFKQAAKSGAAKRQKAAAIVGCEQVPAGASFESYRGWEKCKKDVLKRQKAMTRLNPSNRDNELWCKGHIPLSFGPNTNAWLSRCNPGGELLAVPVPPAPAEPTVAAPAVNTTPAANAPAAVIPSAATPALPATSAPVPAAGEEAASSSAQAGFDTSGTMTGAPSAPPSAEPAASPAAAQSPASQQPAAATPSAQPQPQAPAADASGQSSPAASADNSKSSVQPAGSPVQTKPAAATPAKPTASVQANPAASTPAQSATARPSAMVLKTGLAPKPSAKGLSAARKVLDCGLKPFLSQLADQGFEAELKKEVNGVLSELSKAPAKGRADVQQVYSISRNTAVKTGAGEKQVVLSVGVQRMDADGEVHVDIQYSLSKSGEPSVEGQTIVFVSQAGKMTPVDVKAPISQCLGL